MPRNPETPASPIPVNSLVPGAYEGVMVGAVAVYRFRNGWGVAPETARQLWGQVCTEKPQQDGERLLSVTIPVLNMTVQATRAQCSAYAAALSALTKAAKKATAPARRQAAADRNAAAAKRLEMLGAAMRGQQ